MSTPFGPQLIGETEKTLNALLRRFLEATGLTEPQWVTLRLAGQLDGSVDSEGLVVGLAERAHFTNAADLVHELNARGLLDGGRLSSSGREVTSALQARIATETASIWHDLPDADVDSATRLLNEIVTRARRVLASSM
ncbi:MAG TPA: hypothetical protein VME46_18755 [Acidimicrobiales bacterium]|nr:hypothetical protein [Acidimicrobiales bacterium]